MAAVTVQGDQNGRLLAGQTGLFRLAAALSGLARQMPLAFPAFQDEALIGLNDTGKLLIFRVSFPGSVNPTAFSRQITLAGLRAGRPRSGPKPPPLGGGVFILFKQWLRRFNGVAAKYLPSYLGWRRWLEKGEDSITSKNALAAALC